MNCPICKSPIADNATVCEWCGVSVTPKSSGTVNAICREKFGPLDNGVSQIETPCPHCSTPNTIHSLGIFCCPVCKIDWVYNESVCCPKCSKQIVITNNLDLAIPRFLFFGGYNIKCPFCENKFNFERNKL